MPGETHVFDPAKSVGDQLLIMAAQLVDKSVEDVVSTTTGDEPSILVAEAEDYRR